MSNTKLKIWQPCYDFFAGFLFGGLFSRQIIQLLVSVVTSWLSRAGTTSAAPPQSLRNPRLIRRSALSSYTVYALSFPSSIIATIYGTTGIYIPLYWDRIVIYENI